MGLFERLGDLDDLAVAVVGAEVDRRADAPAPSSAALRTEANMIWSAPLGYVSSSLWFNLTMNGILCAYLRETAPRTPTVEATALVPPSIASLTMLSGSK